MQDINNIEDIEGKIPPVDVMRSITATPEDLFKSKVDSLTDSMVSSMVQMGQRNGVHNYTASLRLDVLEDGILDTLKKNFEEQGYKLSEENVTQQISPTESVDLINLTISWEQ